MEYMCVNCGGGFTKEQMYFDTEYDCDSCQDCYPKPKKEDK